VLNINYNLHTDVWLNYKIAACSAKVLVFGAKLAPNRKMTRLPATPKKTVDHRARQSLRLEAQLWAAIDVARSQRPGNVSRNTWITEAILEKITREGADREQAVSLITGDRRA
jgi:LPS sulfotransferase NodH